MPRPKGSFKAIPDYRLHKSTGRAVVTIAGQDHYLGPFGSPESRAEYDRLVGLWLASGRPRATPARGGGADPGPYLSVVLAAYLDHCAAYYAESPGHLACIKSLVAELRQLFGRTPAADFGPLALTAFRDALVAKGLCRNYVNAQVGRVRRLFKWAAARELLPAGVHEALKAVDGLRRGKTGARESERVRPVDEVVVEATLPHLSRQLRAIVRLQLLTGMRPGEACVMRTGDIDRAGPAWRYWPQRHKNEHRGLERVVLLGPQAQEIVTPFLKLDPDAYLFSPADADRERRDALHAARLDGGTPLSCGNRPGTNVRKDPKRRPGARYTPNSMLTAITRAADRADAAARADRAKAHLEAHGAPLPPEQDTRMVPRWHPNQLRHTAATRLRREFGIEAASVILGHEKGTITLVYAEADRERAAEIMGQVG